MQRAWIPLQHRFYHRDPNWCRLYRPNWHKENYQKILTKTTQKLECALKAPSIAQVVTAGGSWSKLWDGTRHLSMKHLRGLQNLTRLMAHNGQGSKPCPLCDAPTHPLIEHVLTQHHSDTGLSGISESPLSTDKLLTLCIIMDNF